MPAAVEDTEAGVHLQSKTEETLKKKKEKRKRELSKERESKKKVDHGQVEAAKPYPGSSLMYLLYGHGFLFSSSKSIALLNGCSCKRAKLTL